MDPHPRYRFEDGMHSIDVRVANMEQLFDNRDPVPFRERDLDPDLVEYLVAAAEDLSRHGAFRILLWCSGVAKLDGVDAAFRAHFEYELTRLARENRRRRGIGAVTLVIALVMLGVLLTVAQLIGSFVAGSVGAAIREGLTIFSWVVLWRPVEVLVYDWIPPRRRRSLMQRLHDAPIEVRKS